ncbi:hypothetical protein [Nonlabens sp.]|uniref:hypothetical protein n=1 Tax=Nonlabens sp. TaxID=1888209 RepID=UPI0032659DAC
MKNFFLFTFLILISVSCNNSEKPIITKDDLIGKTFDFITPNVKLTWEFKDSTYNDFENRDYDLFWEVFQKDGTTILAIEELSYLYKIVITSTDNNEITGYSLENKDYRIHLKERPVKWDRNLLQGKWINENFLDYNDNVQDLEKHPMSLLPGPKGLKVIWPPLLTFKKDTIYSDVYFETVKSPFNISGSNEYITLELWNEYGFIDKVWEITTLNDSVLIVNQTSEEEMGSSTKNNVRFVKQK